MAKNLLDLANSLEKKVKAIEEQASKLAADVALVVITELANSTPVDTTNAVINWHLSLGSPSPLSISPLFIFNRTASIAAVIQRAEMILKDKKPGQPIFITNNEDYIIDLNNGSSLKAPAGFVQRAVLLGKLKLRK